MLQLDGISVHYGRIPALHDVSLTLGRGETVAVVGPNGAGKSTMLLTIMGVVTPSSGAISYEGNPLVGLAPERIVRLGISLVPEGRRILSTLTVEENLRLGATIRTDSEAIATDIEEMYERFPILRTYARKPAATLSCGEQQQLAIARALLPRPQLLLLDEPSLGLGPLVVDLVFEVLEELTSKGVTILLVEQNAMRAIEFADRTYVLQTGRVTAAGTRDEVAARTDIEALFLGA
jgi:branched-chain amino acid transport system ATP-binding protein